LTKENRIKKSNLYTKTGDACISSFYNEEKRPTNNLLFELLGHQDELNALIGIGREHCVLTRNRFNKMLIEIQSIVFDLGALVTTSVLTSSNWLELILFCTYSILIDQYYYGDRFYNPIPCFDLY
jgi:cob(I)alamin adenosyltransferase